MPTTFPLSTYPLSPKTTFSDDHKVGRDELDDGDMTVRVLSQNTYRMIKCVFSILSADDADTFEDYLRTNRTTEFDIIYKTKTYRGYIWSEPKTTYIGGANARVSFMFRGLVV